jgi:hypothetical protein
LNYSDKYTLFYVEHETGLSTLLMLYLFDRKYPVNEEQHELYHLFGEVPVKSVSSSNCLSTNARKTSSPGTAMDNRVADYCLLQKAETGVEFDLSYDWNQKTTSFGVDRPTAKGTLGVLVISDKWLTDRANGD